MPSGDHRDGTAGPRVLERAVEGLGGRRGRTGTVTDADIDDLGAVVDEPPDAGGDVIDLAVLSPVEDLGDDEVGARCDAGDADPVAGRRRGDAGDERSVTTVVLSRAGPASADAARVRGYPAR